MLNKELSQNTEAPPYKHWLTSEGLRAGVVESGGINGECSHEIFPARVGQLHHVSFAPKLEVEPVRGLLPYYTQPSVDLTARLADRQLEQFRLVLMPRERQQEADSGNAAKLLYLTHELWKRGKEEESEVLAEAAVVWQPSLIVNGNGFLWKNKLGTVFEDYPLSSTLSYQEGPGKIYYTILDDFLDENLGLKYGLEVGLRYQYPTVFRIVKELSTAIPFYLRNPVRDELFRRIIEPYLEVKLSF